MMYGDFIYMFYGDVMENYCINNYNLIERCMCIEYGDLVYMCNGDLMEGSRGLRPRSPRVLMGDGVLCLIEF